jgi:hypothetical protein
VLPLCLQENTHRTIGGLIAIKGVTVKRRLATSLSRSRVGVSQRVVTSPDDLDEERQRRRLGQSRALPFCSG